MQLVQAKKEKMNGDAKNPSDRYEQARKGKRCTVESAGHGRPLVSCESRGRTRWWRIRGGRGTAGAVKRDGGGGEVDKAVGGEPRRKRGSRGLRSDSSERRGGVRGEGRGWRGRRGRRSRRVRCSIGHYLRAE